MATEPKTRILVDVLEEHFEQLAFLWMLRQQAAISTEYVERQVDELEARMEAHVQGILIGGEAVLPWIEAYLEGDPSECFAAGYILLRLENPSATARLMEAFAAAEGDLLDGLRAALGRGLNALAVEALKPCARDGPDAVAAVATEVLAMHRCLIGRPQRLDEFLAHEDPAVHATAWRIVAALEASGV